MSARPAPVPSGLPACAACADTGRVATPIGLVRKVVISETPGSAFVQDKAYAPCVCRGAAEKKREEDLVAWRKTLIADCVSLLRALAFDVENGDASPVDALVVLRSHVERVLPGGGTP